jgi:hypothetical protein
MKISNIRIQESRQIAPGKGPVTAYMVSYDIEGHGTFTRSYPEKEFTPKKVQSDIRDFAIKLQAMSGDQEI